MKHQAGESLEKQMRVREMAPWVKVLTDQSSIPETHGGRGEPTSASCPLTTHSHTLKKAVFSNVVYRKMGGSGNYHVICKLNQTHQNKLSMFCFFS